MGEWWKPRLERLMRRSTANFALTTAAISFVAATAWFIGTADSQVPAEPRLALIVANQDYPASVGRLTNPHRDAEVMAAALKKANFDVILLRDLDKAQIAQATNQFSERLLDAGPEAVGFFYYSGHGASTEVDSERHNYLLPSRTEISNAAQLAVRGARLTQVIDDLAATEAKAIFVVFDACRNTLPLSDGTKSAADAKGFTVIDRASGLYIAFATSDGQTTPDDGIFAQELAAAVARPGLTADRAFTLANRSVAQRRQTNRFPFIADGLRDDVCFISCPVEVALQEQQAKALSAEIQVFKAALEQPTVSGLSGYLGAYPAGQFSDIAQRRLQELRDQRQTSAVVTGPAPCAALEFAVYFEWDRTTLSAPAEETIRYAAERMRQCKISSAVVTGHTDSSGSSAYNIALSARMASSVGAALATNGVPADLITTVGVGEAEPAVPTPDGVREPLNRRVDVAVTFS